MPNWERKLSAMVNAPMEQVATARGMELTDRSRVVAKFYRVGRWSEEQIAQRSELVSRIGWLVADGSELAHKAIGYLLSYDEVSCVIPGIRTLQQLESNLAATQYRFTPDEREKLEVFWDRFTGNGSKLLPW